jgi:hypothetical protein
MPFHKLLEPGLVGLGSPGPDLQVGANAGHPVHLLEVAGRVLQRRPE